jgi:hypothetical protein
MPIGEDRSSWSRNFLGGVNSKDHPSALDPRELADGTRNVFISASGDVRKRSGTSLYSDPIAGGGPILGFTRAYGLLNSSAAHTIAGLDVGGEGRLYVKIGAAAFGDPRTGFEAGRRWSFTQWQNLAICMNGEDGVLPQVWDGSNWFDLGISADTLETAMATTAVQAVAGSASLPPGIYKFVFVDRINTGAKAGGRSGPMPSVISHRFDTEITTIGQKIQFTNAPIPGPGHTYELYATNPNEAIFYRIHEFDNGDSASFDWEGKEFSIDDGLGPELYGVFDASPPSGCKVGTVVDGRLFLANNNSIYWSSLGNPHNFDPSNRIDVPGGRTISALFSVSERLFLLCDRSVYRVTPAPPGYYLREVVHGVGCIAPKSVAEVAGYLVFLGHSGVHAISISGSDALAGTETPDSLVSDAIQPWLDEALDKENSAGLGDGYTYYLSIRDPGKAYNNRTLVAEFDRPQAIQNNRRLARWTSMDSDSATNPYGFGFNDFQVFSSAGDEGIVYGACSTEPRILRLFDPSKPNSDYIPDGTGDTSIQMTIKTGRMTLADLFQEIRISEIMCQWLGDSDVSVTLIADWGEREERFTQAFLATGGSAESAFPWTFPVTFAAEPRLDLRSVPVGDKMLGRTFQVLVEDGGQDSNLQLIGLGLTWSATGRKAHYVS